MILRVCFSVLGMDIAFSGVAYDFFYSETLVHVRFGHISCITYIAAEAQPSKLFCMLLHSEKRRLDFSTRHVEMYECDVWIQLSSVFSLS
jgi:hypothetical protein